MTRLLLCTVALALSGCTTTPITPYTPHSELDRDTARSERLAREGADAMHSDPARAESLLREALAADLYNGPAHNNLGVVCLKQARLYEAAGEFEWARKLLPGHPDPRMNLALTLERAGRTDEALSTYRTALEVYPGHVPSMQALARLQVRAGKSDDTTREHLREIAMRGENSEWREWARLRLAQSSGQRATP